MKKVSASGYTAPAANKAKAYGVTLYSLIDWPAPKTIGGVRISDAFAMHETGYEWVVPYHIRFNPMDPTPEGLTGPLELETPVYDKSGAALLNALSWRHFAELLASNATALAEKQGIPIDIEPGHTKEMTFTIMLQDEPFVWSGDKKVVLKAVQIAGQLAHRSRTVQPTFKILVRHEDQTPFVGCAIVEVMHGNLMALSFDATRELRLLNIPIGDRLLNKISRLRLPAT